MKELRLVKAIVRYNHKGTPKYLLLKKAKDDFCKKNVGKWECVGGLVEEGETSEQAIIREVKQETGWKGLEFKVVKQLPTIRMTSKDYDSICNIFLIDSDFEKLKISEEHSDYQWVEAKHVEDFSLVLYANLLLEYFNNPDVYLN
jgi:8-oxo-dGTP diphosphatase